KKRVMAQIGDAHTDNWSNPQCACEQDEWYKHTVGAQKRTNIYLHMGWAKNVTTLAVAATLVHEASHKCCDTRDYAYISDALYQRMPPNYCVYNADSYSFTAASIAAKTLLKDDEALKHAVSRL